MESWVCLLFFKWKGKAVGKHISVALRGASVRYSQWKKNMFYITKVNLKLFSVWQPCDFTKDNKTSDMMLMKLTFQTYFSCKKQQQRRYTQKLSQEHVLCIGWNFRLMMMMMIYIDCFHYFMLKHTKWVQDARTKQSSSTFLFSSQFRNM